MECGLAYKIVLRMQFPHLVTVTVHLVELISAVIDSLLVLTATKMVGIQIIGTLNGHIKDLILRRTILNQPLSRTLKTLMFTR